MANSLARQVEIVTWPPFFDVLQPITRRLRHKKLRQLEENIVKNDGCGNKFNASGFFKTETAYININFFAGFYCFLTCSSKNYTVPADERRNNFTKMTHPFIMLPDTDVMNMKCKPDSGFLMAHTAINKPCFFLFYFPWQLYWRTHQNFCRIRIEYQKNFCLVRLLLYESGL